MVLERACQWVSDVAQKLNASVGHKIDQAEGHVVHPDSPDAVWVHGQDVQAEDHFVQPVGQEYVVAVKADVHIAEQAVVDVRCSGASGAQAFPDGQACVHLVVLV